jgi:hypothetical protein
MSKIKKKLQSLVLNNCNKVKYKVTGPFGGQSIGDIIEGYLITVGDEGIALIYFPYDNKTCGCFEICKYDLNQEIWMSQSKVTWVDFE